MAFAIGILFCLLLMGKVAFAVAHYFSHMTNIILIITEWVFLGTLHQDLDNLVAAAGSCEIIWFILRFCSGLPFITNHLARSVSLVPARGYRLLLLQSFFQLSSSHTDKLIGTRCARIAQEHDADLGHVLNDGLVVLAHSARRNENFSK